MDPTKKTASASTKQSRHALKQSRLFFGKIDWMRCFENVEAYLADSRDALVIDRPFSAFHAGSLFGIVCWGRPTLEEASRLVYARGAELRDAGPHCVVNDYRLLDSVDPEAFKVIAGWLAANSERLAQVTSRAALLIPTEQIAGATVAGFYKVVKSPYPAQVCTTLEEAEAWLGVPTVAPVTEVCHASAAGRATASALISVLERTPGISVDDAAEALGLSSRTLQRRLKSENTTYVIVARNATIQRAKQLLRTTDTKVAEIAAMVGCVTPQHFSEIFRIETGMTPAAWRQAERAKR